MSSSSPSSPTRTQETDKAPESVDPFQIDDEELQEGEIAVEADTGSGHGQTGNAVTPTGASGSKAQPGGPEAGDETAAAAAASTSSSPSFSSKHPAEIPEAGVESRGAAYPVDDDEGGWGAGETQSAYAAPISSNAGGVTPGPTSTMTERGAQTSSSQSSAFPDAGSAPEVPEEQVTIIDAQKTSDGVGAGTFIAYLIRCGSLSSKRRYSEFASLRDALVALHPTVIVPPIPQKHSLSDYAAKQSRAKEDATIIARRRRMLQVFLNRVKDHERLGKSVVFRRFLDGRWSWHEITNSPPLSTLPKSNLRAPAHDPSSPHASPAYLALAIPPNSTSTPLRHPNQRFLDSEGFTERFKNHIQTSLEKTNRRVVRRWGEAASDYAELGAVLNVFSLSESGPLAMAIEKTGLAADSTFMAIGSMLQEWETLFTEPLNEYSQFASILQKLLKWRHLKHLQFELAEDALEAKRLQLEELERIEMEASRLNAALESGGRGLVVDSHTGIGNQTQPTLGRDGVWDSVNSRSQTMRKSVYGSAAENNGPSSPPSNSMSPNQRAASALGDSEEWTDPSVTGSPSSSRPQSPPTATNGGSAFSGPTSRVGSASQSRGGALGAAASSLGRGSLHGRRGTSMGGGGLGSASRGGGHGSGSGSGSSSHGSGGGGGGLLGALSSTFHSVMDVDPEATRRNTISRLKDQCAQLEEALKLTAGDLKYATQAIQADLDRFQRQKVADFRDMALQFAKLHREFCRVNLESWKEAKEEIDRIEDDAGVAAAGMGTTRPDVMPESSLARAQSRRGGS